MMSVDTLLCWKQNNYFRTAIMSGDTEKYRSNNKVLMKNQSSLFYHSWALA